MVALEIRIYSLLTTQILLFTNPFKVCICTDSVPNCSIHWLYYRLIPGKPFKIDLVAVGQWNGIVPANIQLEIRKPSQAKVKASEYIHSTGRDCTELRYTFTYLNQYNSISLKVITNRNYVNREGFIFIFILQNCTLGFSFNNEIKICV